MSKLRARGWWSALRFRRRSHDGQRDAAGFGLDSGSQLGDEAHVHVQMPETSSWPVSEFESYFAERSHRGSVQ